MRHTFTLRLFDWRLTLPSIEEMFTVKIYLFLVDLLNQNRMLVIIGVCIESHGKGRGVDIVLTSNDSYIVMSV